MTISVLIADDHSVVRKGLRMFLGLDPELEVVGEATNGSDKLSKELSRDLSRKGKYLFKQGEETMQRYYLAGSEQESPFDIIHLYTPNSCHGYK
jgi:hypothetical protein